jgi:hypothetical protein
MTPREISQARYKAAKPEIKSLAKKICKRIAIAASEIGYILHVVESI